MDDKTKKNGSDVRETTRKLADIFKDQWTKEIKHIDTHIENKTNSIVLKYLGIRWQSIMVTVVIVLGFMAAHTALIYMTNDYTIKSSISKNKDIISIKKTLDTDRVIIKKLETSMDNHKEDMGHIKRTLASTNEVLVIDRKIIRRLEKGVNNIERYLEKENKKLMVKDQ